MFDNYVGAKTQKRRKWVGITIIASVALHVLIICGLLARSFWVLEKLTPPDTTVAIAAAPPPPPPPPAGSKVHHHTIKPHLHKVHAMVQPDKHKKQPPQTNDSKDNGVEGGIQGGVTGGVVGGVLGGTVGGTLGGTGTGPPQVKQGPRIVPQVALEAKRIAGEKDIEPGNKTKTAIKRDARSRVVATVKMCLSAGGSVTRLHILSSSGYPAYDRRILSKMHGWRYRPFRVNGKPVPVCTSVTFIYSQSN